jgi:hypothetical protein
LWLCVLAGKKTVADFVNSKSQFDFKMRYWQDYVLERKEKAYETQFHLENIESYSCHFVFKPVSDRPSS